MNPLKNWLDRLSKALGLTVRQRAAAPERPDLPDDDEGEEENLFGEPPWQPLGPFVESDVKPLLKPCPRCGRKDRLELNADTTPPDPIAGVICSNCGLWGPTAYSVHEAVSSWNSLPRRGDP